MLKASPTQKSETCFRGPWTSHGVLKKTTLLAPVEGFNHLGRGILTYRYLGRFPKESPGI